MADTVAAFDPAAEPRAFRDALGSFPTGVTVVTCATPDGGRVGITANSFASVSLDPPLVLWSPAKASSRHPLFVAARYFAIHVLTADQTDICARFAKGAGFEGLTDLRNAQGVPVLEGVLARFDCALWAKHDGGDHTILVGRVLHTEHGPGEGLCFARGQFRTLAARG